MPVYAVGDRVRVTTPDSAYTGCRGTVVPDPNAGAYDGDPLGYYVAIDGENGIARPFLAGELEGLRARTARPVAAARSRAS